MEKEKFFQDIKEAAELMKNIGNENASNFLNSILSQIKFNSSNLNVYVEMANQFKFLDQVEKNPVSMMSWIDGNETLGDKVRANNKIGVMKMIRMYTGLGLSEAIQVQRDNWWRWNRELDGEEGV